MHVGLRVARERTDLDGRSHLAFGHGPHCCLGAALARLEGSEAFARLAEPLRRVAPDSWTYARSGSHTFRELSRLRIGELDREVVPTL